MRDISLPVLYKAALPPAESDFDEAADLRKLGGRVTAAALAIEELMVGILSSTLLQEALYYSWGYPEKSNDWGRGGKQIIFPGGQNVYLDGKLIRDWQSLR